MNDVFKATSHPNTNIRTFLLKPNQPLQKTNNGQSGLSNSASGIWNGQSNSFILTDDYHNLSFAVFFKISEVYLEQWQTFKKVLFAKALNGIVLLTIFAKSSIFNIWLGFKYISHFLKKAIKTSCASRQLL